MFSKDRAISYWVMGERFLRMANVTSEQLVVTGNPWVVSSNEEISPDKYNEETKWSDHNIGIPILFNFYHGIELMLKGTILFCDNEYKHRTHKFTLLIQKLKEHLNEDSPFIKKIESYTVSPNSIIKNFLDTNQITIDNWYESLKYPENNDNQEFTHLDLIYNSLRSLDFWKNLSSDSLEIIKLSGEYYLENRDD